jgi:hypothetical protein
MKETLVKEIVKNVGVKVERDNSVYPADNFMPMFKLKAEVEIYTRKDIEEAIKMYVKGYNYYEIFGKLNGEHTNK